MSKIWIVVADEAKARILATNKSSESLVEIKALSSTEAHEQEQDLVSDKPGRGSNGNGQGKHAMDEKTTHKEQYAIRFAKQLGDLLEKNQYKKSYMKLIIVAAPRFLGLLRKELSKNVTELVSLEIDKDLTMLEPQAIREHLPQYL
jgi:protein required for attachment to host cells